ncbi:Outer membrane scaffolding protein for murein synthesis, MipA/OmpV family [Sphingomonas gellani]|uniref:Outer membrane scaffolding protein for murein synthesis, MipA/OmpV family n=1 Tax=Sphingomonas gellani TaxID=1166340 RepID=A0A1H8HLP3_9SPHN|nr:MipA/OmpV family protein [Sphingomonas gellani]SEN57003.1 Outer membrane scaffolding protein for murein synthesis, MipA/OmpV family [Sphingomonas gellani]
MRLTSNLAGALAPVAILFALPAAAQVAETAPPDAGATATQVGTADMSGDSITVGLGAAYLPDYEGSDDYRFVPAPGAIGSFRGFNFTLAGNRLSVDLIPDGRGPTIDIQAGPIGVINFNRSSTKSIDDDRVKALGKVDTAVELGGYVGIGKTGVITSEYDRLSVSLSYRHDVSGTHKSGIWQPTVNYFTPLSRKAAVGLFASAEHAGNGYADAYFSVTPTQSLASTLPVYDAGKGWKNYTIGALGAVSVTGDLLHGFKLVGNVTYRRMLNDFADSPLVSVAGSRSQWLGVLGVAYTF